MLRSLLNKLVSASRGGAYVESEQRIGGSCFDRVRSMGPAGSGHSWWIAYKDNVRLKIYRAHSENHAEFISNVSQDRAIGHYYPKIIDRHGEYVVAEWIEGEEFTLKTMRRNRGNIEKLARMQAKLHRCSVKQYECDYDYVDFIISRVDRAIAPLERPSGYNECVNRIANHKCKHDVHLSHPDITPRNIIVEKQTGNLKIVDNELLGLGKYYHLDLFNTYHNIKTDRVIAREWLRKYVEHGGNIDLVIDNAMIFESLWKIRWVGTLIKNNDVRGAFSYMNRMNELNDDKNIIIGEMRRL